MPIILNLEPAVVGKQNLNTPVLRWPPQLDPTGKRLLFVEQNSVEEISQCVGVVYSSEPGDFPDEPDLGLEGAAFSEGGVAEAELVQAAAAWEPRASVEVTSDELVGAAQTVGVNVEGA